ncbi:hypothetical protein M011DRAFT_463910 [Sporormia fimetaria CBS 119925]|uniref:Uncharacterized protein n=1 Tax=Sporormia fimetaria CBS 119925 TaxID=1340428 RepID=A0A6A6VKP3_9PLEO|nr:hypothetical protein M011DRAFT_463910 [Sporormia fimetaria CBS 119925]
MSTQTLPYLPSNNHPIQSPHHDFPSVPAPPRSQRTTKPETANRRNNSDIAPKKGRQRLRLRERIPGS